MQMLIEPVGKYAENPYFIRQLQLNIYSVEELCFIFCRDPFLLDQGIVDEELVKWLDRECGLDKLARELYPLVHREGSPSAVVGIILRYVDYESPEKRQAVEALFRESADMDIHVKKKNHADHFVKSGKFVRAISEYEEILEEIPEMDHSLKSKILNNKGVALCRLFRFADAAKTFLAALDEDAFNEEALVHYLATQRLVLDETQYLDFIAERKAWMQASIELESRIDIALQEFARSGERILLRTLQGKKNGPNPAGYYEDLKKHLDGLKTHYRDMVEKNEVF